MPLTAQQLAQFVEEGYLFLPGCFAEEEVARGRSLVGLFPAAGEDAKRDFETWKKKRSGA